MIWVSLWAFELALCLPHTLFSDQTVPAEHQSVVVAEQYAYRAGSGYLVGNSCHHDDSGQGVATEWDVLGHVWPVGHRLDMPGLINECHISLSDSWQPVAQLKTSAGAVASAFALSAPTQVLEPPAYVASKWSWQIQSEFLCKALLGAIVLPVTSLFAPSALGLFVLDLVLPLLPGSTPVPAPSLNIWLSKK